MPDRQLFGVVEKPNSLLLIKTGQNSLAGFALISGIFSGISACIKNKFFGE